MKFINLIIVFYFCVAFCDAQITLNGVLMTDLGKPVPKTKIGIAGGQIDWTDSKGQFCIQLSSELKEGYRVILFIKKKGWVISHPLDGEWNLPNKKLQNIQYTKVIIVPRGSKALWSHERIEKYIAEISDKSVDIFNNTYKIKPVDFSINLKNWAEKYGFTITQVKAFFDEWANGVKSTDTEHKKGLRNLYQNNLAAAAINFKNSAFNKKIKFKSENIQLQQTRDEIYDDFKLSGDAYSNNLQFKYALAMYDSASRYVSTNNDPKKWAEIKALTGLMKFRLGYKFPSLDNSTLSENSKLDDINRSLLDEAIEEIQSGLTSLTKKQYPNLYERNKNIIGFILWSRSEFESGKEKMKLLKQSEEIFRTTLTTLNEKEFPEDRALALLNLDICLSMMEDVTEDEQKDYLYAQVVETSHLAMAFYTKEQYKNDWAQIQYLLGMALTERYIYNVQNKISYKNDTILKSAEDALNSAIPVFNRKEDPNTWANIQYFIGRAYFEHGILLSKDMKLSNDTNNFFLKAKESIDSSLIFYTKNNYPKMWGRSQIYLGNLFHQQGVRTTGEDAIKLLKQSEEVYQNALPIFTKEKQIYWSIQYNLGMVLFDLGIRLPKEECLIKIKQSFNVFRTALTDIPREHFPLKWATIQMYLGTISEIQGDYSQNEESKDYYLKAIVDYRSCSDIFYDNTSIRFIIQNSLSNSLWKLGHLEKNDKSNIFLKQAVDTCQSLILTLNQVHDYENLASAQIKCGNIFLELGKKTKNGENVKFLNQALDSLKSALKIYTFERFPQYWASTNCCIGITLKEMGIKAKGKKNKIELLNQSIFSFYTALTFYTKQQYPQQWNEIQNNLNEVNRCLKK